MRPHGRRTAQRMFGHLNRTLSDLGNHLFQRTVLSLRPLCHRLGRSCRANNRRNPPNRLGRNFRLHTLSAVKRSALHHGFLQLEHRRLKSPPHPSPRRLPRLAAPPRPVQASTDAPSQTRTRLALLALGIITRHHDQREGTAFSLSSGPTLKYVPRKSPLLSSPSRVTGRGTSSPKPNARSIVQCLISVLYISCSYCI